MNNKIKISLYGWCAMLCLLSVQAYSESINRKALVERHNPSLTKVNPASPFSVGNGRFTFTADITGLQSLGDLYYEKGIPLETKARKAWYSRANKNNYTLKDASVEFSAYGTKVDIPTNMNGKAGQWLRKNPHDLPLARIGFLLNNKQLSRKNISQVEQTLNLWRGELSSKFVLHNKKISVVTAVHENKDIIAASITSPLMKSGHLSIAIDFPRGYDLGVKNTPRIDWQHNADHSTQLVQQGNNTALFTRIIDSEYHLVRVHWQGTANLVKIAEHRYQLKPSTSESLDVSVEFFPNITEKIETFSQVKKSANTMWREYWLSGAVIDFGGSKHANAVELERRVILSQYLMGVQSRAKVPTQETGLTSSSWYGKHHTEMAWWHTAHWTLWNRNENTVRVLAWYIDRLDSARKVAKSQSLRGARWSKMVGPENRESPGGNPLIIWNQPQVIHLAELLYQSNPNHELLQRYAELVEATAEGLSSMLQWEKDRHRYSLKSPIWISQEIYDPTKTENPSFELSYWRYGLKTALLWRERLGKNKNSVWAKQLNALAALPQKNGKYVAIESIPDTFDNIASRQDHPTMLAPFGLLNDETVDEKIMSNTLQAVLDSWDWKEKIWGWDYPMIAMTALRLGKQELALDILLKNAPHNHYLPNGHCPQEGANLAVYLPANGALLSAVAMLANYWVDDESGQWKVKSEGFRDLM